MQSLMQFNPMVADRFTHICGSVSDNVHVNAGIRGKNQTGQGLINHNVSFKGLIFTVIFINEVPDNATEIIRTAAAP